MEEAPHHPASHRVTVLPAARFGHEDLGATTLPRWRRRGRIALSPPSNRRHLAAEVVHCLLQPVGERHPRHDAEDLALERDVRHAARDVLVASCRRSPPASRTGPVEPLPATSPSARRARGRGLAVVADVEDPADRRCSRARPRSCARDGVGDVGEAARLLAVADDGHGSLRSSWPMKMVMTRPTSILSRRGP